MSCHFGHGLLLGTLMLVACSAEHASTEPGDGRRSASTPDIKLVECMATLIAFQRRAPFYVRVGNSDLDGVAPEATFELSEPSRYLGMQVRVQFLFSKHDDLLADLDQQMHRRFLLELPEDDLEQLFSFRIDDAAVGRIEVVPFVE